MRIAPARDGLIAPWTHLDPQTARRNDLTDGGRISLTRPGRTNKIALLAPISLNARADDMCPLLPCFYLADYHYNMGRDQLPPEPHGEPMQTDFWFQDGNIVIIAGSAAFKVHRGQLERHSEVFSDLFSLPQPEEQALVDGCSSVELQDCPSDVFYFLSALYDGL